MDILSPDGKNVKPVFAAWPAGWWDQYIDPTLNPVQVVEKVDELTAGLHPALPRLRQIARAYEAAKARHVTTADRTYRCFRCHDTGWVETASHGRGQVERCGCARPGPRVEPRERKDIA